MEQNLLVAAKIEYTEQLQDILKETIYDELRTVWYNCKSKYKRDLLRNFQISLCEIPRWNQEIINNIYKNVLDKNKMTDEYLDKIIEAIFLSNIKILSVVKLSNKKQTINIKVPDTKHFIHKCLIESARNFYTDPFLIDDREIGSNTKSEIQRNIKRSFNIIKNSIEKTIRSMIPMEDILNQYLESHKDSDDEEEIEQNLVDKEQQTVYKEQDNVNKEQESFYNEQSPVNYEQNPVKNEQNYVNYEQNPVPLENYQDNDFEQMPEPPRNDEYNPQENLFNEEKIKIDLKEEHSPFFSDSE